MKTGGGAPMTLQFPIRDGAPGTFSCPGRPAPSCRLRPPLSPRQRFAPGLSDRPQKLGSGDVWSVEPEAAGNEGLRRGVRWSYIDLGATGDRPSIGQHEYLAFAGCRFGAWA